MAVMFYVGAGASLSAMAWQAIGRERNRSALLMGQIRKSRPRLPRPANF
jgi:hypothetical protein